MPTNRNGTYRKPTKAEQKRRQDFWNEWNETAKLLTAAHQEAVAKLLAAFGEPVRTTVYSVDRDESFDFRASNGVEFSIRIGR